MTRSYRKKIWKEQIKFVIVEWQKNDVQNLLMIRIIHIFIYKVCRHGSKELKLRFLIKGLLLDYKTIENTTRVTHSTLHKANVVIASK